MPSFDTVLEPNLVELRNAVEQANKEIGTRFDFKGSGAHIDLADKGKERALTLFADNDFQLAQVRDILLAKLAKRGVDVRYADLTAKPEKLGGDKLTTASVPGFIPRTGNLGLSWRHRGLSARVNTNYTGSYLDAANVANPALNLFRHERTIVNAGIAYQLRPTLTLSLDVANIFNERPAFSRGFAERLQSSLVPGTTFTFGVGGRF